MAANTIIRNYTEGNIAKQVLVYSAPFVLSNLLQTFYNLVDMAFIGRFVGQAGLSAVSVGGDILNLFTFICMGFTSVVQIILAQYVGKREYDNVGRTVGTASVFILSLGALFMLIGFAFGGHFLTWMHVPDAARSQARAYTLVCYSGLIFIFGYNMVSAIQRGMGDSKTPFLFVALATVINIVLDYTFIVVMKLEALGAALGTVIGQCVAFLCSVVYLYRKRNTFGFRFSGRLFIPNKKIMGIILRLGIPSTLQFCAINLSGLVVNAFINDIGLTESAVNAVAHKIGNIASIVTTGLNSAGAALVGQNFGAGKLDRVKRIMGVVAVASVVFAAILSALLIIFPEEIFGIFNKEEAVLAMCHSYVIVGVLSFFGFASRAPFLALVNGQGFAALGFTVGMLDGVVFRIGISILLGTVLKMGITGFWLGSVLAGYTYLFVGGAYFFSGKWRTRPLAVK